MGTWSDFSRPESKNIEQLFEFPKNLDQDRRTVFWTSQSSRPEPKGSCLNLQRPKVLSSCLNFPTPEPLDSCLNFETFKTKTVGQLYELRKTKGVWHLVEFPTNLDQNRWTVIWNSQENRPKPWGSCLNLLRPKVWGSCLNFPTLKPYVSCLNFQTLKTKTVGHLFESRPKPLGSWSKFSIPESKNVEQMFELHMTQDQNRRAVVWTY